VLARRHGLGGFVRVGILGDISVRDRQPAPCGGIVRFNGDRLAEMLDPLGAARTAKKQRLFALLDQRGDARIGTLATEQPNPETGGASRRRPTGNHHPPRRRNPPWRRFMQGLIKRQNVTDQPVSGAWNCLDLKQAGSALRGDAPHSRNRPVEAVVPDDRPAPALIEQYGAGDDLPARINHHQEDLHDDRFKVNLTGRPFDLAARGADRERAHPEIGAPCQIRKLLHSLSPPGDQDRHIIITSSANLHRTSGMVILRPPSHSNSSGGLP